MANFQDLDVSGKTVLVRVDFNVPLDDAGAVTDDTRVRGALPTIESLLERGAAVVLMSHLGRPQKKKREDGSVDRGKFSIAPAARRLGELLGLSVTVASDVGGEDSLAKAKALRPGEVLMIENTRFEAGEEQGDRALAERLAALGSVYVNDAFGAAHRAHSSTTTVAEFYEPHQKAAGLLMAKELEAGQRLLDDPARPFVAITGGAKVSDKVLLLEKLLDKADHVIVGGGMAYTFAKALGGSIGTSLVEPDLCDKAREIMALAEEKGTQLHFPLDNVCTQEFAPDAAAATYASGTIPDGWGGLDIGVQSRRAFADVLANAKTVLWNGPMGVFEFKKFAAGTYAVAEAVAETTDNGAYSLIGGGDSASAINQGGFADRVSFVSTGGGAMLELLEGKTLPGVAALEK